MAIKREIEIPSLSGDKKRRLYVYLPEDYDKNASARYPVLYMFDGHNVFFDEDATFGKSWGMNEYMLKMGKQLMIVAVECNQEGHKRLEEYSPVDFVYAPVGKIEGRGDEYIQWLVSDLKPSVDAEFRTLPGREHTAIAGSSMGGLMAMHAAVKYNCVFSKAACLSPSLWIAPKSILEIISGACVLKDTAIYMDYGSKEMKNHPESEETLEKTARLLRDKGIEVAFRLIPDGTHSESSWQKQIPVFMECLKL
ncbi:MAG: alpha/beta hydrolase [Clostridia bacterium]|nr:alpha/beta hydrolase [Clostridia bacterium]